MNRAQSQPANVSNSHAPRQRRWLWLGLISALICPVCMIPFAGWGIYKNMTFRPSGQILFNCWPEGASYRICLINADGTERRQLTDDESRLPVWSPDGTRIVFSRNIRYSGEYRSVLFIMNAGGSGITQLTDGSSDTTGPNWSPDGGRIAFVYYKKSDEASGIATIKADGTDQMILTDFGSYPSWPPDGTRIAFIGGEDQGGEGLYVMNAHGSDPVRLADAYSSPMDWSPDGKKIAFLCGKVGGKGGVCVINADGAGLIQLTHAWERSPSWSPDGEYIAYEKSDPLCILCNLSGQIWVMKADGTQQTKITDGPIDQTPAWSPNPDADGGSSLRAYNVRVLFYAVALALVVVGEGALIVWAWRRWRSQ